MNKLNIPFNIYILQITDELVKYLKPVTSLDIFNGQTKQLHPEGLFSTEIFGTVGTDSRYEKYSYIDVKIPIIHPTIYKALIQLKGLYKEIMSGKEFAIWDEENKDFVKSNAIEGQTGFHFFLEHWKEIEFQFRPSVTREQNIQLIEKYKEIALSDKIFVIPAGYRDIEIDEYNRESSDEINKLYYKLIAISNTIQKSTVEVAAQAYNSQRNSLQNTFNEIYDYILKIIEGKKNLIMGKWASRKIFNGTRNVITSMDVSSAELNHPKNVDFNDCVAGIYQCAKALLPITKHQLKTGFLSQAFQSVNSPALLCNSKTLQSERVLLTSDEFDEWMTNEGLDEFITSYKEPSIRHNPIMVRNYYLGLTYRGKDNTFKFISGIDQLPSDRDPKDCKPITMTELLYVALYSVIRRYPAFIVRYPIASDLSSHPCRILLKSTNQSEERTPLDDDWRPHSQLPIAYEFPITGIDTYDSLAPNTTKLKKLGADNLAVF